MWSPTRSSNDIYHHGILGQKWGQRNGPPYPLKAGAHSSSEKKAGWKKSLGDGRNESEYGRSSKERKKDANKLLKASKSRYREDFTKAAENIINNNVSKKEIDELKRKHQKCIEAEEAGFDAEDLLYELASARFEKETGNRSDFFGWDEDDDKYYDMILKERPDIKETIDLANTLFDDWLNDCKKVTDSILQSEGEITIKSLNSYSISETTLNKLLNDELVDMLFYGRFRQV